MLVLISDQTRLHAILFCEAPLMAAHLSSDSTTLHWNYFSSSIALLQWLGTSRAASASPPPALSSHSLQVL